MGEAKRNRCGLALLVFIFLIAGGLGVFPDFRADDPARTEESLSSSATGFLARFPFVFDGRILIPLRINDSPPLDIILDSGFSQRALLLMHEETGDELGLTYVRTVNAIRGAGSGENKDAHVTAGERLSLPGLDLGQVATAVIDESRDVSPHHNLGVIGGAIFIPYVVEIDFGNFRISLYDPASYAPEEGWEEIPLAFGRNLPILETTLRIGGRDEIPVRLIVDTGGKPPLALAVDVEKKLLAPAQVVHFLSGTGLRGDVFADHGRLSELKVGRRFLKNMVSAFWTGKEAPVLTEVNADGVLGLGSLYRFNMVFDYAHERMFIKSNRFFSDPFELNMAGMTIEETTAGDLAVYYVMDGSEAAKKGLRKGDVLVEVDGRQAGTLGYRELKQIFGRDGKTVAVKIRRDGQSRDVKLKLKRLI